MSWFIGNSKMRYGFRISPPSSSLAEPMLHNALAVATLVAYK